MSREAFILDGVRTPVGRLGGSLSTVRVDDLAAQVIADLVRRVGADVSGHIDDVILGCANQAGEDNRNLARMALLLAGLPWSIPGETVNRLCSSGMSAAVAASRAVRCGDGDLFIAGGAENMTRGPYVMSKPSTAFGRDARLFDTSLGWRFPNPRMLELYGVDEMGNTAENLVSLYGISREDQDAFALRSQQKAAAARASGRLAREIVPVSVPQRKGDPLLFEHDEFIRANSSLEALSRLKPAFRKDGQGSVTAGNSSGLNDGAAAMLVGTAEVADQLGLARRAKLVSSAVVGVEPRIMGIGPVDAGRRALQRAGLEMSDIDVIELNEAFAAQSLAVIREWGLDDDDERINPNGGAIAIGHPLGMSGARLLISAVEELAERDGRFALCALCVGVGQGMAVVLEREEG